MANPGRDRSRWWRRTVPVAAKVANPESDADLPRRTAAAVDAAWSTSSLRALDRLRFSPPAVPGGRHGTVPARGTTQSAAGEVERFRPHAAGDDPRQIDWNAVARLDQMVVRLFRAERELPHYVLLDASASMACPTEDGKFEHGAALAAAWAYVAVRGRNPFRLWMLGDGAATAATPLLGDPRRLPLVRDALVNCRAVGDQPIDGAIDEWLRQRHAPGLVLVVSDFLADPAALAETFRRLAAAKHEAVCVRLIGAAERDPAAWFRQGRVVDSETGAVLDLRFDTANRQRYLDAIASQHAAIASACRAVGVAWVVLELPQAACDMALRISERWGSR